MLRLLEEKGFVSSQYHLAEGKTGPGRSKVVFAPTDKAHQVIRKLADGVDEEDWELVKERILESLQSGGTFDPEFAHEIMARIPQEEEGSLRYCLEIMTIIALRMRGQAQRKRFMAHLPLILPDEGHIHRESLFLLGGFALGIIADENPQDAQWRHEMIEHLKQYQNIILNMNRDQLHHFTRHLKEVFAAIDKH
jgi:hypothetical protein